MLGLAKVSTHTPFSKERLVYARRFSAHTRLMNATVRARRIDSCTQGLTLAHLSAQLKRSLWDRGVI